MFIRIDPSTVQHLGVGDSYLCVANLEEEQPDHAIRIVDFAFAVLMAAADVPVVLDNASQELGSFKLRIGKPAQNNYK